jgi:hypothetical protein
LFLFGVTSESKEDMVFKKCGRFLTLEYQPQKYGVASSARGESGFTSQRGYAKEACFQKRHLSAGVSSEHLKTSAALTIERRV